ncbi:MAG: HEAT repeat domain-containing protein [Planctomycetes bacterium]|nr:HEAT repeat domain-containing protein [Planctomycetota bacterium]
MRLIVACCVAIGVLGVVAAIGGQVHLARCKRDLLSPDAKVRARAVQQVIQERERRALPPLIAMLEKEQDRRLVEDAGLALLRTRDPAGVAVLRRRADEPPDDYVRGELILWAARLSGRDARLLDWLNEGVRSPEPWRAMGSALGLIELGRPEGGPLVIEMARQTPLPYMRHWAIKELCRTADALSQTVGRPMSWLALDTRRTRSVRERQSPVADQGLAASQPAPTEAELAELESFWQQHVDSRLLCDVLQRINAVDPGWAELGRLIHARDEAAKWLQ